VVDYVRTWAEKTELPQARLIAWLGVGRSKFFDWSGRFGRVNEHNAWVPRDHWLTDAEKRTILDFRHEHPLDGYRQLSYMMLDRDLVAVSPTSVYRVLRDAGLLGRAAAPSKKGTGFVQPLRPHEHWHVDVSYVNIKGTFYFLCSVLDGASRYLVHWDLRETMKEFEIEAILQAARERFPGVTPRVISDNGPQFVAKDFKAFIRLAGMTHVRTAPFYPQSNGKVERWHQTIKRECLRPRTPLDLNDAKRSVTEFVRHYNDVRLHSGIGYITPKDHLEGRADLIHAERDRKLAEARQRRAAWRQANAAATTTAPTPNPLTASPGFFDPTVLHPNRSRTVGSKKPAPPGSPAPTNHSPASQPPDPELSSSG
jgi:transposase InsO family protein